jgi:cysteine desulfurase/selenocysteine lyase
MKHYLNNAGAALMSAETLRVIETQLHQEIEVGAYQAAQNNKAAIENFYAQAAKLINAASSSEIAYMDSASRAWNMVLYGLPIRPGDTIITLSSEFGTNLVSLFHLAAKTGAVVKVIPCDLNGHFDINEIENSLNKGARIVALSHVAAHGAIVNPVVEIGKLAKKYEALYIVDGCQAVGQIDINVQEIRCDAYTATGRKWLRGPRGTGFLYVKAGVGIETQQVDLASADLIFGDGKVVRGIEVRKDARQFELWERSIAGMLGLATAMAQYLALDHATTLSRMRQAARKIREAVARNPRIQLIGDIGSESAVTGFYVKDPSQEADVRNRFESSGIGISSMSDWDCPLHFPRTGVSSIFRLAPHYYTSDVTIELAEEVIKQL